MKLRPPHLIDIVTDHGHGTEFGPHPYGHALHTVAAQVLSDPDVQIEFVLGADDICAPCCHLQPGDRCDDVLSQLAEPVSKQAYNDALDSRLFPYLEMQPGAHLTMQEFLVKLEERVPGIEQVCAHPGEEQADRLEGLRQGLRRLGL